MTWSRLLICCCVPACGLHRSFRFKRPATSLRFLAHKEPTLRFAECVPLLTSVRFVHTALTASSALLLAREIQAFVPSTFTSIQQISRQVPPELMEQISSPTCGGLRQLLARYPDWYESKQIGQVHVVRRRAQDVCSTSSRQRNAASCAHTHGAAWDSQRSAMWTSAKQESGSRARAAREAKLAELRQLFPDFLVPVKALWTTVVEGEEAEMKRRVLDALREHNGEYLLFYEHPEHRTTQKDSLSVGQNEQGKTEESAAVFESGYVRLCSTPAPSSPVQHGVVREDDYGSEDRGRPLSTDQCDVCMRLAEHEVQPYEWYRVARVLPTAAAEVAFGKELCDAAGALLPPGRDAWQVLLSAPHLFTVRYGDAADGTRTLSGSAASAAAPYLMVRFRLHPRFIPAGVAFVQEAELLRELEELAVSREENRCGLNTRQRRRKRKLQRQLTYLRNPTPYFDDRVLAQHLFDLLPLRNGVHQSALLGALPPHAVSAFPQNVTDLLKVRDDLFRLSDARHGVLVQRADAPLDAPPRTLDSVTGDEILQCIFASYSTRHDPRQGTTVSRSLPRLPRLIRERLFSMNDVVEELLCLYPEKVVVLSDALSATTSEQQAAAQLSERARRELQNVRGRRDFLVPFRFVGEWESKLMEKYTEEQEKEAAKSAARHRGTSHRRARF